MSTSLVKILPILLGGLALSAQAIPITGQLNIQAGSVVLTPNQLGLVTSAGASHDGLITSVEGDYPASLLWETVDYKPFTVAVGLQSITDLWSVTDMPSGFSYSFDLSAISSVIQTKTNLFINGSGVLKSTNALLDPTMGFWSYGVNSADGSSTNKIFSFQSNNVSQNVPDGGSTLFLMGAGLLGLVALGRRMQNTSPKVGSQSLGF